MQPKKSFLKPKKIIVIGCFGIVLLAIAAIFLINNKSSTTDEVTALNQPTYDTVLPEGKTINSLGGWNRVSPADSDPVYAYIDTLNNVSINVSEQALPAAFTNNTDAQVADLAKKFNATTKLQADEVGAYIGTSATGPQSVIFAKKDVLVLIKSKDKVDDKTWVSYINSLN